VVPFGRLRTGKSTRPDQFFQAVLRQNSRRSLKHRSTPSSVRVRTRITLLTIEMGPICGCEDKESPSPSRSREIPYAARS